MFNILKTRIFIKISLENDIEPCDDLLSKSSCNVNRLDKVSPSGVMPGYSNTLQPLAFFKLPYKSSSLNTVPTTDILPTLGKGIFSITE